MEPILIKLLMGSTKVIVFPKRKYIEMPYPEHVLCWTELNGYLPGKLAHILENSTDLRIEDAEKMIASVEERFGATCVINDSDIADINKDTETGFDNEYNFNEEI